MKIIFVPALPLNPPPGNLGQIWEVKVRNCRSRKIAVSGEEVAVVKMMVALLCTSADADDDEVEDDDHAEEDRPTF